MDTPQQQKLNILLIGDLSADIYTYGNVGISNENPITTFTPVSQEERPGMAGNLRENLKALGLNVFSINGDGVSAITRLFDIKTKQLIFQINNPVTSKGTIPVGVIQPQLENRDAVVIYDNDMGLINYEFVQELRSNFTNPIFVHTNKTDLAKFEGCILNVSRETFSKSTSRPSDSTEVVINDTENGVLYSGMHYPFEKHELYNNLGCDDTFFAGLIYQYLNTRNMQLSIRFGLKVSNITSKKFGSYYPKIEEII